MTKLMASTKVMDELSSVGLNSYERKLYVTLLSKGVSSAGALSENSTVPRSRCYDVLESLREKGFVVVQNTKPIKYVAVKPSEALDRMKSVYHEKFEEAVDRIDRMKKSDSLKELDSIFKDAVQGVSSADMSGSIKGRHQVHQHIESSIKRSKKSLSIMTTQKGLEEIATTHLKHLKAANDRGVNIRIAAPISKQSEQHARALSEVGEVRHSPTSTRMFISDENEVTMALTHDDVHPSEDMHFWSQSDHVSSAIAAPMFDNAWKSGKKF